MQQFRLRAQSFKEIQKKTLVRLISVGVIVVSFSVVMNVFSGKFDEVDLITTSFAVAFPLVMLSIGFYLALARQKKMYESYRINIGESMISREQLNTPTVGISPLEVSEIVLNHDRSFTVKSNTNRNTIIIPAQIENYDEVYRLLSEIMPITAVTKKPFFQKFQLLLNFLTVAMMTTVYISTNKILVAIAGSAVITILVYGFIAAMRNTNLDNRTKVTRWIVWLVIFSIAATMYFKLSGDFPTY